MILARVGERPHGLRHRNKKLRARWSRLLSGIHLEIDLSWAGPSHVGKFSVSPPRATGRGIRLVSHAVEPKAVHRRELAWSCADGTVNAVALRRRPLLTTLIEEGAAISRALPDRSEERRVGKECRSRWS